MTTEETPDPRDVRNAGKDWTDAEVARLRNLSIGSTPMRLIVRELGRSEAELQAKAEEQGFALSSENYNRFLMLDDEQNAKR
jgi:hypothetical protein